MPEPVKAFANKFTDPLVEYVLRENTKFQYPMDDDAKNAFKDLFAVINGLLDPFWSLFHHRFDSGASIFLRKMESVGGAMHLLEQLFDCVDSDDIVRNPFKTGSRFRTLKNIFTDPELMFEDWRIIVNALTVLLVNCHIVHTILLNKDEEHGFPKSDVFEIWRILVVAERIKLRSEQAIVPGDNSFKNKL